MLLRDPSLMLLGDPILHIQGPLDRH